MPGRRVWFGGLSVRRRWILQNSYDPGLAKPARRSSTRFCAPRFRGAVATVRFVRARPSSIAAVAIVAAVIGGVAVLAVGKAAGWLDSGAKKTVIVQTPAVAQAVATSKAPVAPSAKPLVGNGFDPRQIFASRAPGVVTIYAIYG